MGSVHENGRAVDGPDLRAMIDGMGGAAACIAAMADGAVQAADALEGIDRDAVVKLHLIADDATESLFYLRRALRVARELL